MVEKRISKSDMYRLVILKVLQEQKKAGEDRENIALWKNKITEKAIKLLDDKGCSTKLHRATVGRHVRKMINDKLVEEVFFPEGTNPYADKGYVISKKGEDFLEANRVSFYTELGSTFFANFIFERWLEGCEICHKDEEECIEHSKGILTNMWMMDEEIVEEALQKRNSVKDVREVADLLSIWEYLREAIEHGTPEDDSHKQNPVLKHLAMRDPRLMEMICNTYSLPLEDIADIYEGWGEGGFPLIPIDHYLAVKVIHEAEEKDGLTADEVKKRLVKKGITYDPSTTLEKCASDGLFMEKEKDEEKVKYGLTKAGKKLMKGAGRK